MQGNNELKNSVRDTIGSLFNKNQPYLRVFATNTYVKYAPRPSSSVAGCAEDTSAFTVFPASVGPKCVGETNILILSSSGASQDGYQIFKNAALIAVLVRCCASVADRHRGMSVIPRRSGGCTHR
jgi:hypothetical protein